MSRESYIEECREHNEKLVTIASGDGKRRNAILSYLREGGQKTGIVLAYKDGTGEVLIGWSKCNKRDRFDRDIAIRKAISRAIRIGTLFTREADFCGTIPYNMVELVREVRNRAIKYFKLDHRTFTV